MTAAGRDDPNPERVVRAGELALGLEPGREASMRADPVLAAEVDRWEQELARFADEIQPVPPDPQVWQRLDAALGPASIAKAGPPRRGSAASGWFSRLFESLTFWRGLAGAGFATAAGLALLLAVRTQELPLPQDPGAGPPLVARALLVSPILPREGPPSYVATYDASRETIVVVPAAITVSGGEFPQLWLVPNDNETPIALGALDPDSPQAIALSTEHARLVNVAAGLVITLEPEATVPSEAQGPVVAHGRFTSL